MGNSKSKSIMKWHPPLTTVKVNKLNLLGYFPISKFIKKVVEITFFPYKYVESLYDVWDIGFDESTGCKLYIMG